MPVSSVATLILSVQVPEVVCPGSCISERGQLDTSLRLLYLGDATPVTEPVDPERVDATAAEVRDVWDRLVAAIKEETFEPTAGPLCKFCAHRDGCPAYLP